jgi:hypothetical protein
VWFVERGERNVTYWVVWRLNVAKRRAEKPIPKRTWSAMFSPRLCPAEVEPAIAARIAKPAIRTANGVSDLILLRIKDTTYSNRK